MKILMISTEAYPYAKAGGLADVVHGLARALRTEAEQDVRIFTPLYSGRLKPNALQMIESRLEVPMGYYSRFGKVWKTEEPFPVYLLQHEFYFERDALYGYLDDYERFIFFTRAALQMLVSPEFGRLEGDWFPDIVHGFNGLTGLMPYWLANHPRFENTRFVLTLHNMDAPAVYGARALLVSEQTKTGVYPTLGESRRQINFLGRGLAFADRIGMVNPDYEPEHNPLPRPLQNLEHVLKERLGAHELLPIRNGIDVQIYDPGNDPALVQPFTHRTLDGRLKNKLELQKQAGLAVDPDRPLLGLVGRMQAARGFDHLEALKAPLLDRGQVQLVVLGEPENRRYLEMFESWEAGWETIGWDGGQPWLKVYCDFDEQQARQIYAGCDLILIPALQLPSGTQQYTAMHYGAVPVVHRTGALYNSVMPYTAGLDLRGLRGSGRGVGFAYDGDGPHFLEAVQAALDLYWTDRKIWRDLQRHNMSQDFSWTEPAEEYLDLYHSALAQDERRTIPRGVEPPYDPLREKNERLLQAVREIDRLPGMRRRDIRYMLKHTARLIRWVLGEDQDTSVDVYVWVAREYLQPESSPDQEQEGETTDDLLETVYTPDDRRETMQVVSSLWRDTTGRHLPGRREDEVRAEHLLSTLAEHIWPTASDWLGGDDPPLGDLCQALPDLRGEPLAQAKGWRTGWSAIIASHSRIMGRIDILFSAELSDDDATWIVDALATLSSSFGLRLEAVRFALEKDQALNLAASLVNAQTLDEALAGFQSAARKLTQAQQAWVYLCDEGGLRAAPGVPGELALAGQPYAAEALSRREAVYVRDWPSDRRHDALSASGLGGLRALIAAPLLKQDGKQATAVGVLVAACDRPAAFSLDQLRWVSKLLAPQAAAVLDTFRQLEARNQQRLEQLTRLEAMRAQQLQNLANSLVMAGDFDQLLKTIVRTTATELEALTASIYLYDKERELLFLEAAFGYQEELLSEEQLAKERPNYKLGEGVTGYIAVQKDIVRANSLQELRDRVPSYKGKYLCGGPNQHEPNAFLGIPLYLQPGEDGLRQVIGVMKVEDRKTGVESKFSAQDELLAQMMGNVIATVVHNIQVSRGQLNILSDNLQTLSKVLVAASDLDTLLQQTVQTIADLVGAKASSLYLVDEGTNQLVIQAAAGYQGVLLKQASRPSYAPGQGVTGWIWQENREFKANNYEELHSHPAWKGKQDDLQGQTPTSFLGLPLSVTDRYTQQQRVIGVLKIEDVKISPTHRQDYFTAQDVLLVKMMANVIATVVYNTQFSRDRLNTLQDNLGKLSQVLARGNEMDTLLDQIVLTIADLVGAKASSLYLVDETTNQLVIQAAAGYQEVLVKQASHPYAPGEGVTGWIWQENREFKADNYQELHDHPAWKGKQDDLQGQLPTSFVGLPLTVTDRDTQQPRVIGVLKVEDVNITPSHPEGHFTAQDVLLVKMMANVIATVVYNAQLSGQQLEELLRNISTLTNALAAGGSMEMLVNQVVETTARVLNAKAASLYLVDKATDELVIQAASGYQKSLLAQGKRATYARGEGVTGWIWQKNEQFKADNYQELHDHPAWKGKQDDLQGQTPTSFVGLPLKVNEQTPSEEVIGVLKVEDVQRTVKHPEAYFTTQDVLLVTMMGKVIGAVIETARNGERRIGELLKGIDPQLLYDASARSLPQSFSRSQDEGMIDQLAINLAAQLDSHPELLLERVKMLFEAEANPLLYHRVAVHAQQAGVRQQFQVFYQAFSQASRPYLDWLTALNTLQPWLELWEAAAHESTFCTAVGELTQLLAAKTGLRFTTVVADADSAWVGVTTETDPVGQPLIHSFSPRILIACLRQGPLDKLAWHQLVRFAKQVGEFQISVYVDWRQQVAGLMRAELRRDPELRHSDVVIASVRELVQMQREAGAPALLRALVARQLNHSSLFILQGPVPEEMFFGRRDEISRLLSLLKTKDFALVGNRQIGKTSLMKMVMRRLLETDWAAPLWIDCQAFKSAQEFVDNFQLYTAVALPSQDMEGLETALSLLKADRQRQPVLFVDEVDLLVEADLPGGRDLVKRFRSLAQRDVCHFVFGGSKLLASQLQDANLRLYNFAESLVIGLLSPEEGSEALAEPLKAMEITLEKPAQTIRRLLELTSCHPNLIQQAGHWLSMRALGRDDRVIVTEADVKALEEDSTFAETCIIRLWGEADPLERLVTLLAPETGFTEAEMEAWLTERGLEISPEHLSNALKALVVYSILHKEQRQYRFAPSGFKRCLANFEDVERLIRIYLDKVKLPA